jgi:nucleoside phosphorylase/tetratricopeptide (TPR) repeat protein
MASLTSDDYTVAWICALPLEAAAASVMLDKIHRPFRPPSTDPNAYVLGELNGHFIAIACLPTGIYGTVSAATVMAHMCSTFRRIQFALLVEIGGGVPSTQNDIRLGDVVVSKPMGRHSGVIQYDYGKTVQGGKFEQTGMLNHPPQALLTYMAYLQAAQMTKHDDTISKIVGDVLTRNPDMREKFGPQDQEKDYLFPASYHHLNNGSDCDKCDKEQLIARKPRDQAPQVHYGLIASGDQVMKDSETRDCLAQQFGVLCFEMEAAGLMNQLPTLVIRGICDYCDSHKQKDWQGYAALTAAAYTKSLLSVVPASTDPSQLKNSRRGHWMVPLARNPRFVGRLEEINKVQELIMASDGPRRVAITGLGGVGKTQIALELAYRIRDLDKACSIFWIPCTSLGMIDQGYLNIAQTLGLCDVNPAQVNAQIKTYLSSERAGKWLLIFDNADDMDMWPTLEDALPESGHGRVLFTTRNRKLAVELASSDTIPIPDVDEHTALKILEKSLINQTLLRDSETAVALLKQLTFLPLAIAQASAYINKNSLDLSTYLELLQEKEPEIVDLLSEDFRDAGRYKDIQNPVITTWLISFEQIQRQNQLAADLLSFMACINPRNIPYSLLPSSTSKKRKLDALGLLSAYSFTNAQDMDISLHRLVHIAMRNWLRKSSVFSHWIQRAADRMAEAFPNRHYTNRGLWRQYLPHALALVHEEEFIQQREHYLDLLDDMAGCLRDDGRYHEAELLQTDVMEMRTEKDGHECYSTFLSIASFAETYCYQGRWAEAEELQIRALEIGQTVLGAEHPHTLISMNDLALTYWSQERWTEAEELGIQVLEIRKNVLGAEHPHTLTSMHNLASTYWDQGRWAEAEELQTRVLRIQEKFLGAEHPDTLISVHNLAATYRCQGRRAEAEELGIRALETLKIVLGAEHPDTLTSMSNLSSTWVSLGKL